MSNIKRTVELGTAFTKDVYREIMYRDGNTVCNQCRQEYAIHADHIMPLAFEIDSSASNGQALCGKCHNDKSKKERAILAITDPVERAAKMSAFVAAQKKKVFANDGTRLEVEIMKTKRADKVVDRARRISFLKRQANLAKQRGAGNAEHRQHQLAAAHRRNKVK